MDFHGVAVTPDGKHAYVADLAANTVSVIDTSTNTVGTTIPVGTYPDGVAIAPDGNHVYVTHDFPGMVSVIDTGSNTVAATIALPGGAGYPLGVAVTPDGKRAYVANNGAISVINTGSNTVVATVAVGSQPIGVAVTPDGKNVYVANTRSANVSVIATATNNVVATLPVGPVGVTLWGVAVTPDGKQVYVANVDSSSGVNTVSVIDTATNTVGTPIQVGSSLSSLFGVGIMPPPASPTVPFLAFSAQLQIHFGRKPNQDVFALQSSFTLSSTAPAIDPVTQPVTLQVGTFTTTIPPGSFKKNRNGSFTFVGIIGGVSLQAVIAPTGTLRYAFVAAAQRASLTGSKNPVPVMLTIGANTGTTSVKARIF
jgi:YVTN family beta-propeller protein